MSFIENPFFNKNTITHYDEFDGKNVEIDQSNVSKYFTHVFILIKKNNDPIPIDFYNWQVNKDIFEQISSNLIIHKTSVKVLKNNTHFNNCILLSDEQLKIYNIFNYELTNKNIVIPIFNIEYTNILKYLEQYQTNNTLQNIYNIKVLNKYFDMNDSTFYADNFICQIINNLEHSHYWTNSYNCKLNMSIKFKERNMSFQSNQMTDKNIASIVRKIFDTQLTNDSTKENYIKDIEMNIKHKKHNYVDISSVIKEKGFTLYKLGAKTDFTREDINQLFAVLNEKQRFLMFANLMASNKYCHLVINNEHILQTMNTEINKFAPLFKYLMSYAWIRFYIEECITKSWVKTSDDFIFDINTASQLPVFPFNHSNPKENPYSPILISDSELNPSKNICGIGDYNTHNRHQIICNLEEFKFRMNIFCTGNPNTNLFEGFDFDKYKVGITGSLMTACLQKNHPLMSRFNSDTLDKKFINYFNEYYATSDVDIMFIIKNTFEFIDNVNALYKQIVINICKFNSQNANPSHVKLILTKLGYLFVNEEFINKNINFDDPCKNINKVKYVINNINDDDVKSKFQPFYEELRIQKYKELINNYSDEEIIQLKDKYPDIFTLDRVDFKVYINNNTKFKHTKTTTKYNSLDDCNLEQEFDINHENMGEINLVYTYKYKIESPHINHPLELFSIKYNDFLSVVSRFHLPCVRSYYNGSNVYLTPSCISAHMTYMNLDYKYITGSKDPIDIINKYRMRGFGTWLNAGEKNIFVKYSQKVPFWNNLYLINSKSTKNIFGILSLNHKLFKPRLYNIKAFDNEIFVDTSNRYSNIRDYPNVYNNVKNTNLYIQQKFKSLSMNEINWNNFESIDKNGYIVPLKKWIIAFTWDIYDSKYNHK
jgi:hypothetical protein